MRVAILYIRLSFAMERLLNQISKDRELKSNDIEEQPDFLNRKRSDHFHDDVTRRSSSLKKEAKSIMLGYLIDMDGVIYRSNQIIPGADKFICDLQDREIPFLFLTNNSQRTRLDVATKLKRLGIPAEEKHIFTCAMATARFLARQKPNGTAFVIGEGGLHTALHRNGYSIVDKDPDYVVVGEGRTMSFEMFEQAVGMILAGAKLIATNLDPNCPTMHGTRPGCGAIVSLLETATGYKAFSVGKPSPIMLRAARKQLGLSTSQTIVIGDTMSTDILGGVQMGYKTMLVLSGGTKMDDLRQFAYKPDLIVDSLAEITHKQLLDKFENMYDEDDLNILPVNKSVRHQVEYA